MKISVWIQYPEEIPAVASLIDMEKAVIEKRFWDSYGEDRLCIFQTEVTQEQWNHIRRWKGDRMITETYLTKEK